MLASIMMDINAIGSNMKTSSALKWVVTEGTSTNIGNVLAQGNFIGTNNGDTLTLFGPFKNIKLLFRNEDKQD